MSYEQWIAIARGNFRHGQKRCVAGGVGCWWREDTVKMKKDFPSSPDCLGCSILFFSLAGIYLHALVIAAETI